MNLSELFEAELAKRRLSFTVDAVTDRYVLEFGEETLHVSIENLRRDFAADQDPTRVARFVDAIITTSGDLHSSLSADQLYWCLEPNDYSVKADFRVAVSDRVDRVLVHLLEERGLITWVTPEMLEILDLAENEAGAIAFANLDRALREASLESLAIDEVQLGYIASPLPFKASLLLAPSLREVVEPTLGWPLMAVAPDRGFLYLWDARHTGFVQRVGGVVLREYAQASHPISTEVFEITDDGISAIGAFSKQD